MKLTRRNAGKRKIFAPTTTVASSDLKSRGVRMSDDSWNFVETFAYNERLGKTDAFEVIVQTFKKWYEEEVNNDYDHGQNYGLYMATQIIDKYKVEVEPQENEEQTEGK